WVSRPKNRKDSSLSNARRPGKGAPMVAKTPRLDSTGGAPLGAQRRQEGFEVPETERRPVLNRLEVWQPEKWGRIRHEERPRLERPPLEALLRKNHVARHLLEPPLGCRVAA